MKLICSYIDCSYDWQVQIVGKFSAWDFAHYGPAPCRLGENQTVLNNRINKDQGSRSRTGVGVWVEDSYTGVELAKSLLGDKWSILMEEGHRKVAKFQIESGKPAQCPGAAHKPGAHAAAGNSCRISYSVPAAYISKFWPPHLHSRIGKDAREE